MYIYQNDFHRSGILIAIIKQTTYLIFLYLLIRYEISIVLQVKYSKMINYKLSIRQYVRSLYLLSSRNHLFKKKKKMKSGVHVKYIIRTPIYFLFISLQRKFLNSRIFIIFFFFFFPYFKIFLSISYHYENCTLKLSNSLQLFRNDIAQKTKKKKEINE